MSRPTPPACKTGNWPAYDDALKRRGSLTIWFDPAMTWEAVPTGKRGRPASVADSLTIGVKRIRKQSGFEQKHLIRGIK